MIGEKRGRGALSGEERRLLGAFAYERLTQVVWVYDFDARAVVWANASALKLWRAETVEELAARRLGDEMSGGVANRLRQYREDFLVDPTRKFNETWTLYPADRPILFDCCFSDSGLHPFRAATLIEARPLEGPEKEPGMMRALDALLHSQVMTGLYQIDGAQLFANRALRETFGQSADCFKSMFNDPEAAERPLIAARAGRAWRETVEVRTKEGPRWHDLHTVPCRDAATGSAAFQISAVDVTETHNYEDALKAARNKAEAADRAKSEFLASMSHEMRTPMNGVLGMLELLRGTALDEKQTRMVEVARESGAALLALVEDVLDLSSVELGAVKAERAAFDLVSLAQKVVEGLAAPAANKRLALTLDAASLGKRMAMGDERRIAQLMRNLIGNAIKYTHEGGITLRLAAGGGADLLIEVSDSGKGVPDDRKALIFRRFHREETDSATRSDGLGLGLAICRELVALWGGEIGVRDAPGGGACFWFTVPDAFRTEAALTGAGASVK